MATHPMPRLEKVGDHYQLLVEEKPFIILGGELAASSMTSSLYMERQWHQLKALNLNTVFGAISWSQFERVEGHYDFTVLTQIIHQAREHDMRLVVQFLGSLKGCPTDCLSDHAPAWVKTNIARFPRIGIPYEVYDDEGGVVSKSVRSIESVSIHNVELAEAEQKAFCALMDHIKKIDSHRTVLLVQIGGQIGLARDVADFSPAAEAAFDAPIPLDVVKYYQSLGSGMDSSDLQSWSLLGTDADFARSKFTAYSLAKYANDLATAGKSVYGLPMLTTCPVLESHGTVHGSAQGQTLSIWAAFAKTIDILSPRMLHAPYALNCKAYAAALDKPLLVTAHPRTIDGVQQMWPAIAGDGAIGVAFTVDRVKSDEVFVKHLKLIGRVQHLFVDARANGRRVVGFSFPSVTSADTEAKKLKKVEVPSGDFVITIERSQKGGHLAGGFGFLVDLGDGRVLVAGQGIELKAKNMLQSAALTRVLDFHKMELDEVTGSMRTLRAFHSEETDGGRFARLPSLEFMIIQTSFYSLMV